MSDRIRSLGDFLALFPEKPRVKIRDGFNVLCPTHNDRGPSLSVARKDSKILLNCKAGCDTEDIVKAIGLELKDLFLNSHKTKSEHRDMVSFCFGWRSFKPMASLFFQSELAKGEIHD